MHKNLFGKAILAVIFLVVLSGGFYIINAQAADLALRCRDDGSGCSSDPDNVPLFNETNVVPGQAISKTFSARNEKSGVCDLKLFVTSETANSDFSKNMYTSITSERGDEFGVSVGGVATSAKNFSDVVSASPIDLGSIDPYNSKNFSWNIKFNAGATNALQGAKTNFDIGLNFQCDEPSGNSENRGSSSSSGSGTTGQVVKKTIKKAPTATPAPTIAPTVVPSIFGRLVAKLRPNALVASDNSANTPSPTVVPDVAGANIENNAVAKFFTAGFWCKWSWIIIVILILIILYLLTDKYLKRKNIK
jgi:hypothetical protein